mgnify:CR=1 FL=1
MKEADSEGQEESKEAKEFWIDPVIYPWDQLDIGLRISSVVSISN